MKIQDKAYLKVFREYSNRTIKSKLIMAVAASADQIIAATFISSAVLASITLVNPIVFLVFAFAFMFSAGLGSYVGLLIGENKLKKASETASFILVVMTVITLLVVTLLISNAGKVAHFLGAEGAYLGIATMYLKYLSIAFIPQAISIVLDTLIMNDGDPKFVFRVNTISLLANFILNLLFVLVFNQGVIGLALATVISNLYHLLANVYYLVYKSKLLKFQFPRFDRKGLIRVLYNGSSDFLGVFIEAVMIYIINRSILQFLPGKYLEAYAAASVFTLFITKVYLGAQYGLQPITSKLMGQHKFDELKELFYFSVKRSSLYALLLYIGLIPVVWFGLPFLLDAPELIKPAFYLYLLVGLAMLASNLGIQSPIFFTAINRPLESLAISILRTLILIPLFSYTMIGAYQFSGIALGFFIPEVIISVGLAYYFSNLKIA